MKSNSVPSQFKWKDDKPGRKPPKRRLLETDFVQTDRSGGEHVSEDGDLAVAGCSTDVATVKGCLEETDSAEKLKEKLNVKEEELNDLRMEISLHNLGWRELERIKHYYVFILDLRFMQTWLPFLSG